MPKFRYTSGMEQNGTKGKPKCFLPDGNKENKIRQTLNQVSSKINTAPYEA